MNQTRTQWFDITEFELPVRDGWYECKSFFSGFRTFKLYFSQRYGWSLGTATVDYGQVTVTSDAKDFFDFFRCEGDSRWRGLAENPNG